MTTPKAMSEEELKEIIDCAMTRTLLSFALDDKTQLKSIIERAYQEVIALHKAAIVSVLDIVEKEVIEDADKGQIYVWHEDSAATCSSTVKAVKGYQRTALNKLKEEQQGNIDK